jgi:hypothetical protein
MRRVFLILPRPLCQPAFLCFAATSCCVRDKKTRGSEKTFLIFIFITQNLLLRQRAREKRGLCMNAFCTVYLRKQSRKAAKPRERIFALRGGNCGNREKGLLSHLSPVRSWGLAPLIFGVNDLGERRSSNYKSKIMTASCALGKRFESFAQIKGLQSADSFVTDADDLTITLFVCSRNDTCENLASPAHPLCRMLS